MFTLPSGYGPFALGIFDVNLDLRTRLPTEDNRDAENRREREMASRQRYSARQPRGRHVPRRQGTRHEGVPTLEGWGIFICGMLKTLGTQEGKKKFYMLQMLRCKTLQLLSFTEICHWFDLFRFLACFWIQNYPAASKRNRSTHSNAKYRDRTMVSIRNSDARLCTWVMAPRKGMIVFVVFAGVCSIPIQWTTPGGPMVSMLSLHRYMRGVYPLGGYIVPQGLCNFNIWIIYCMFVWSNLF